MGGRNYLMPQTVPLAPRLVALRTPFIQKISVKRAEYRGEAGRARQWRDVVENLGLDNIFGSGSGYRRLPLDSSRRFFGGDEAGTEIYTSRTQHKRGGDATSVKDAASGDHRYRRDCVDNLWHERHSADVTTIATCLASLRNYYVDATFRGLDCLSNGRHLQHHKRTHIVRLPHEITRITQRKRDYCWACLQRVAKCFGIKALWNMVHREMTIWSVS